MHICTLKYLMNVKPHLLIQGLLLHFDKNYLITIGGPWYFWPLFGEQTSRILEPSPQGLISSIRNRSRTTAIKTFNRWADG